MEIIILTQTKNNMGLDSRYQAYIHTCLEKQVTGVTVPCGTDCNQPARQREKKVVYSFVQLNHSYKFKISSNHNVYF